MNKGNVIVTGASRGIGKSIALKFAKEGYGVAINCKKNSILLNKVKNEITQYNVPSYAFVGDISDYYIAKEFINNSISNLGSINMLVNNAGISYIGLLTDMSPNEWHNVINTNLTSVFNCCHNIIPHMVSNKSGSIINISSVWGNVGASCEVAYSASKGGVNSFTKALAKELALSNIRVNAISCGLIDTDMNISLSSDDISDLVGEIPLGHIGKPSDVANLCYFLSQPTSSYITGQIMNIDGGWV